MRLIDADALEHKLRSAIDLGRDRDASTSELQAVLEDLEHMPAVQEWISCKERLPEVEGSYLCTYATNTGRFTGECDYDIEDGLGWCYWSDALKKWEPVTNVIAWMPLPAPFEDKRSAEPERDEWCSDCKEYDSEKHCCPRFNRVIRETLEEVQPQRMRGKWTRHNDWEDEGYCGYTCSVCDMGVDVMYNYCPRCGADMRGEQE